VNPGHRVYDLDDSEPGLLKNRTRIFPKVHEKLANSAVVVSIRENDQAVGDNEVIGRTIYTMRTE